MGLERFILGLRTCRVGAKWDFRQGPEIGEILCKFEENACLWVIRSDFLLIGVVKMEDS